MWTETGILSAGRRFSDGDRKSFLPAAVSATGDGNPLCCPQSHPLEQNVILQMDVIERVSLQSFQPVIDQSQNSGGAGIWREVIRDFTQPVEETGDVPVLIPDFLHAWFECLTLTVRRIVDIGFKQREDIDILLLAVFRH